MATNDILTPRFMLEVVEQIPIPRTYMGLGYFPMREVSDEELTWDVLKEEQGLAGLYSIDGKIVPGSDAIFGQMFADIIRIGASRTVKESEWRKLRDPGMTGIRTGVVADIRAEVQRKLATKLRDCNREVDATVEYLTMHALMGYIPWPPAELSLGGVHALGDAKLAIDYNFPSDHVIRADNSTVFSSAYLWTDTTNCDIADQLFQIAQKIEEDAGVPAENLDMIISGRRAIRLMMNNAKLRAVVQYTNVEGLLDFARVSRYMEDNLGVRIRLYTGMYTYRTIGTSDPSDITIHRTRIIPDNKIIFVPRGVRLGDFATSPSQANNWRPGKFTWTKEETNPWRMEMGVGINGFPRMTHPECIIVLQIAEDPTGLKSKK